MADGEEAPCGWVTLDNGLGSRLVSRAVSRSSDCASVRLVCRRWAALGAAARTELSPSGAYRHPCAQWAPWLAHFSGLRCLDLSAYPSHLPPVPIMTSLQELRSLRLRFQAGEREWLPRVLSGLPHLTSLDLSDSLALEDQSLEGLDLPKLQSLDLSGTAVGDLALQCLHNLPHLTRLDLSDCRVRRDCSPLAALPHLQSLSLSGCSLHDSALQAVQHLTTLRHLNLNGCRHLTSAGLACLSRLHSLRSLEAAGCARVSDAGVQSLSRLTSLSTLNLGRWSGSDTLRTEAVRGDHCCLLTDDALVALDPFRRLKSLDLDGNSNFTDRGMRALGVLVELEILCLGGCYKVTDEGLSVLQALTNLRDLQLANFTQISDRGLATLQSLSELRSLGLNGCHALTDQTLELLHAMAQLQTVYLHGCPNISLDAVQTVREASSMTILWYTDLIR